jgi:protein SCO1/2
MALEDTVIADRPAPGRRSVLMALVLVAAVALLAGCGASAKSSSAGSAKRLPSGKPAKYAGGTVEPQVPVPPLRLRNSLGHTVDIAQERGRAVLVTFIYTHCPDVCPLIVGNLHTTLAKLGRAASKLKIIAVSTDPKGDTPAAVRRFLKAHEMTGRMQYLIGSRRQLEHVWADWHIVAKRDRKTPEFVEHSALIYGITGTGKLTTIYPSNFKPAVIVHDAPLLASH